MSNDEFRAVLDWWMCSDPMPDAVPKTVIDDWLGRESKWRGYTSIVEAYHEVRDDDARQRPDYSDAESVHVANEVRRHVCELPDYTSPDDQPELVTRTVDELHLVYTVKHEELEKLLNLYCDQLRRLDPGDEIDLGKGYDHVKAIVEAMKKMQEVLEARQPIVAAKKEGVP